jgi:hypothetical protein
LLAARGEFTGSETMMTGMWAGAVLALALQASGPTVGDTIWLSHSIAVPPGHVVRAPDWDPGDPIELLARPTIALSGDSARISYPVVVWRPGPVVIEIPGPLLLGPGGTVDSLASQRVSMRLRSVLPQDVPDSTLKPQPRAGFVSRRAVSASPLLVLWALATILLLPLHLWWRRRGKPETAPPAAQPMPEPPLSRWADDGEYRAVANMTAVRLRTTIAQRVSPAHAGLDTERLLAELAAARPHWPLTELADLLHALDRARFGLADAADTMELTRASLKLQDRLLRDVA